MREFVRLQLNDVKHVCLGLILCGENLFRRRTNSIVPGLPREVMDGRSYGSPREVMDDRP